MFIKKSLKNKNTDVVCAVGIFVPKGDGGSVAESSGRSDELVGDAADAADSCEFLGCDCCSCNVLNVFKTV